MSLDEVRARVTALYDDAGMPAWPDPHPQRDGVPEEEYSRVTDPHRYRIVHARARAWTRALTELLGATAVAADRVARVTSPVPGTLPLLLTEIDGPQGAEESAVPVLRISVARPDVEVDAWPDCGCDACDSGSEDLLAAVDDTISAIVGGPFVALRGPGWHARWYPDGGGWSGTASAADRGEVMVLAERLAAGDQVPLPAGTEAWVGRSWLLS